MCEVLVNRWCGNWRERTRGGGVSVRRVGGTVYLYPSMAEGWGSGWAGAGDGGF